LFRSDQVVFIAWKQQMEGSDMK